KVKLKSPPIRDKANKELVELIAKEFGVKRSSVEIASGRASKNKLIKIKTYMSTTQRLKAGS
ncbi:MAG: DUF167 domain-containing protein, partial [Nitrospirae bacterium]